MKKLHEIPPISADEATPLVKALVSIIEMLQEANQRQASDLQQMRDEIAVLKGEKAKPKFKSSKMDESTNHDDDDEGNGEKKKRPGSAKRSKTAELTIHEDKIISPEKTVPMEARFKGYRDVVVQGLIIKSHNIRYRLECWLMPDGEYLTGELPASVQGHHYDATLRTYILYQYKVDPSVKTMRRSKDCGQIQYDRKNSFRNRN